MPGSTIDPDNPLVFLVVLLEMALAVGIVSARYASRRRSHSRSRIRAQRAAQQPSLLLDGAATTAIDKILVSSGVHR
jgi:hypothetical protein